MPHILTAAFIAAGVGGDYTSDVRLAIVAKVAAEVGALVDDVDLMVTAASARLALAINFHDDEAAAQEAARTLASRLASLPGASAFLTTDAMEVTVEAIEEAPSVQRAE